MAQEAGEGRGLAEINGTQLYYEVAGEGHPLVLLHAGICDSRMWDEQWQAFTARYRVVRCDIRGCGKSAQPPAEFSLRDDLFELLRLLEIEKTYLLGVSMGGSLAIDFTLEHPEMIDALILVAAGVSGRKPSDELIRQWSDVDAAFQSDGIPAANELEMRMWVDGPRRTPDQVDPGLRARVAEMNANNFAMQSDEAKSRPLDPPALNRLGEIAVPTLIVVGDLDQPDVLESCRLLAEGIPNARQEVMVGTAHLPSMEQPEMFIGIVLDFLAGVEAQQR